MRKRFDAEEEFKWMEDRINNLCVAITKLNDAVRGLEDRLGYVQDTLDIYQPYKDRNVNDSVPRK